MRRARITFGFALIVGGTAGALLVMRSLVGDRTRAEAALAATIEREAGERTAHERASAEAAAAAAASIEPLNAALRAHVDRHTLEDLFENEDWWKGFRADFPVVEVTQGEHTLASRGPDVGHTADDLASTARRQPTASKLARLPDGTEYVLAVARLRQPADAPATLLLARRARLAIAEGAPTAQTSPIVEHPLPWLFGLGVAAGGVALALTGRAAPKPKTNAETGAVAEAAPHEPTSRFGTPARPRPPADASTLITAPARSNASITDGNAVRIRSTHGGAGPVVVPAVKVAAGPGASFGRYRLLDRIGEGGMSELFLAEAAGVEGFTRVFVLKRLRPELARDKDAVAQFIDEARLQSGLVHSNIVPVFDFGVVNGEYFMTQEYILGRDLARLVTRYGDVYGGTGLPETMAYYVAHETLQALAYAHDKRDGSGLPMGIVHRDVSAGNVMVSLVGEVKLLDFGIVKSNRRVSRTQVGMVKGNANFMSPEQARGQTVDQRSDLFSLGHVLYYCLTGRLLYTGDNDLDVLYRAATGITDEDLVEIRKLPDPAPAILEKALALEPAHRFQSATEFADTVAAHSGVGKAGTARLMHELFGDELRRQTRSASNAG
jgi:protein kinase-like protein